MFCQEGTPNIVSKYLKVVLYVPRVWGTLSYLIKFVMLKIKRLGISQKMHLCSKYTLLDALSIYVSSKYFICAYKYIFIIFLSQGGPVFSL